MEWIYYLMALLFAVLIWTSKLNREKEEDEFWEDCKNDYEEIYPNDPPFEM